MSRPKLKIKTGDEVLVISGKDRSTKGHPRRGRVISVQPDKYRVIVDGINIVKKAVRQTQRARPGGITESPAPIHVSNVLLVCPSCEAATRVGIRRTAEGRRVRYCKKCKKAIDQ